MLYGVGQKSELFLKVDNFATVRVRNALDILQDSKFYLEKNAQNLDVSEIKCTLCRLHKHSMHLKLKFKIIEIMKFLAHCVFDVNVSTYTV